MRNHESEVVVGARISTPAEVLAPWSAPAELPVTLSEVYVAQTYTR